MAANTDEALVLRDSNNQEIVGIGNFHKTLPHNKYGEVDPTAYRDFARISSMPTGDYELVATGPVNNNFQPDIGPLPTRADRLVSPLAGRAREFLGPDPLDVEMLPAPGVRSLSTAAEMTELYWMALLRDEPFVNWPANAHVGTAVTHVGMLYEKALDMDPSEGAIRLGLDLPQTVGGTLDVRLETLFRSGLPNEDVGPLVSQFFLHDVAYGTQIILQKQRPYAKGIDFLTDVKTWLDAQNGGYDSFGDGYPTANNGVKNPGFFEGENVLRRIRNMRDLARFVHRDALHQAYFNAALLLLGWGAEFDAGNPYRRFLTRQRGFATLGGPHLLALVSEVASRALKVVWRQKWDIHRRLRPEAYGGLLEMQTACDRPYELPIAVLPHELLDKVRAHNAHQNAQKGCAATLLLPMAFSSGCPIHPAYGAGHASVAGACVTILKAWFDDQQNLAQLFARTQPRHPITGELIQIVEPDACGSDVLPPLEATQADQLTVGGELNKIASNVAMGRSMGGVHWRSDNTRSLRLGEQVATIILRRQSRDYVEPGLTMSYLNFDGNRVTIDNQGRVTVTGDPALEQFYMQEKFAPRA